MKKVIIKLKVEVDLAKLIDDKGFKSEFNNDAYKLVEFLYENEGMGMFEKDPELYEVELLTKLKE